MNIGSVIIAKLIYFALEYYSADIDLDEKVKT